MEVIELDTWNNDKVIAGASMKSLEIRWLIYLPFTTVDKVQFPVVLYVSLAAYPHVVGYII